MKKEFPVLNIAGDDYLFDIDKIALVEKANPNNEICFGFMVDHGSHYEFDYHKSLKCAVYERNLKQWNEKNISRDSSDVIKVTVPRIAVIDPDGMCKKYNCTLRDIAFKSDFEIMVDQEVYAMRMRGCPVMIDLMGKRYEIDVFNYGLIPLVGEQPIYLGDFHDNHFIDDQQVLHLFYDREKHIPVDTSDGRKDFDENLVILEIPELSKLDPIGSNFLITNNPRQGLLHENLQLHHVAKQVPLSTYGITIKNVNSKEHDEGSKQKNTRKRKSKGL